MAKKEKENYAYVTELHLKIVLGQVIPLLFSLKCSSTKVAISCPRLSLSDKCAINNVTIL
jgi:hypothetical protein